MTHDRLLRRVVGPREPGGDAGTPAYFFAEPCGGYQMADTPPKQVTVTSPGDRADQTGLD